MDAIITQNVRCKRSVLKSFSLLLALLFTHLCMKFSKATRITPGLHTHVHNFNIICNEKNRFLLLRNRFENCLVSFIPFSSHKSSTVNNNKWNSEFIGEGIQKYIPRSKLKHLLRFCEVFMMLGMWTGYRHIYLEVLIGIKNI